MNNPIVDQKLESGQLLQLVHGDLTREEVDAIVNAANAHLQHGGGVAAAIARRGGPVIHAESDKWVRKNGPIKPDSPAFTRGGNLSCKYVIHVVGPVWGEGGEDKKLNAAIYNALKMGDQLEIKSISFPAVSTGIFGFPQVRAAEIILDTFIEYFSKNPTSILNIVRLVLFDRDSLDDFQQVWGSIFGNDVRA